MPRKQPTAAALTAATVAAAAAPITPVKSGKSGAKVTVACKLATGLVLQLFEMRDSMENVAGGGSRLVKIAHAVGEPVTVRGAATPFGVQKPLVGGYALTPNVDKDFFDEWMRQNKEHAAVKNGMIFAHESRDHVEGMAQEKAELRSGQEPLDMTMTKKGDRVVAKDPRVPRTMNPNLSNVQPDTEKASAA